MIRMLIQRSSKKSSNSKHWDKLPSKHLKKWVSIYQLIIRRNIRRRFHIFEIPTWRWTLTRRTINICFVHSTNDSYLDNKDSSARSTSARLNHRFRVTWLAMSSWNKSCFIISIGLDYQLHAHLSWCSIIFT